MSFTLTAVIPTKNRRSDLLIAVESILSQSHLPGELIIVDQSDSDVSKHDIEQLCKNSKYARLVYIYDPKVRGLVHAKKVACEIAKSEIVCFLEDDIKLENDYFYQIQQGFAENKNMMGCSGIITNPLYRSQFHQWIFHLFHRGLFRDVRFDVYGIPKGLVTKCILSNKISGGLSAWKRDVFKSVQFNEESGLFMLEDIEFSMRVDDHFKNSLYINPQARLEHFWSPVNRDKELVRRHKKITENFIFFKSRNKNVIDYIAFGWLLTGFSIETLFSVLIERSFKPLTYFIFGLKNGLKA